MTVTGIENTPTAPPKIARELKVRVSDLLDRYTFEEVLMELAKAKPKLDIHVCPAGQKGKCHACGTEQI
jgi:hypothetical protein